MCRTEKSINLGQCIIDCLNNQACESSCVGNFKLEYEQCPCQVNFKYNVFYDNDEILILK